MSDAKQRRKKHWKEATKRDQCKCIDEQFCRVWQKKIIGRGEAATNDPKNSE